MVELKLAQFKLFYLLDAAGFALDWIMRFDALSLLNLYYLNEFVGDMVKPAKSG